MRINADLYVFAFGKIRNSHRRNMSVNRRFKFLAIGARHAQAQAHN
ncbi:hypothetical protein M798_04515 [Brucella melitensis ADMAS-G1]|nr:hypothetical protein M798_04515 [Brucella melitensis ADMAS-G1]